MQEESLEVKLARLDEKLDFVLRDIKELKDDTKLRVDKLETRVDRLEKSAGLFKVVAWGYYVIGAGVIGLLIYHIAK